MAGIGERRIAGAPGAAFAEGYAEAGGFRSRYLEAGHGPPLVCLHGEGGLRLSRAHDLLAERFRVVALEVPGFEASPENRPRQPMAGLAQGMARAATALGLDRFSLMGTSLGGTLALWLAAQHAERLDALVLESPSAIGPEIGGRGPNRDADLEARLGDVRVPALVLFGTRDRTRSESGSVYREKLGNAHLVFVYGAAREIGAERPEAFTALVADFLDRREQFVVGRARGLLHP